MAVAWLCWCRFAAWDWRVRLDHQLPSITRTGLLRRRSARGMPSCAVSGNDAALLVINLRLILTVIFHGAAFKFCYTLRQCCNLFFHVVDCWSYANHYRLDQRGVGLGFWSSNDALAPRNELGGRRFELFLCER